MWGWFFFQTKNYSLWGTSGTYIFWSKIVSQEVIFTVGIWGFSFLIVMQYCIFQFWSFKKTNFSVNFCKLVFVTYMFPIEITLHFRNFQVFQYAWQYLLFRTWVNGYFSCWVEFWKLDTKMPKCQNSFLVRDLLNIIDRLWLLQ